MSWRNRLVYKDGRMRSGFKISFFFLLLLLFGIPGQYVVAILPRDPLQWGSQIVMTTAALLAGLILISHVDQRPFGALGFHPSARGLRDLGYGTLLGALLIGTTVGLLLVTGTAGFAPDAGRVGGYFGFLGWTLLYFGLAAAFEEIVFRGYPFQVLVEWVGAWPAILIGSAIFAFLHGQNPGVTPLALLNIFVAGILLSLAYLRTRSLWFATGLHLGWNWTMSTALDFPVSGLGFDTPLYSAVPVGASWWTGGDFGPEAGLAGTLALAVGIFWLLRSGRVRPDPTIQAMNPLVEARMAGDPLP